MGKFCVAIVCLLAVSAVCARPEEHHGHQNEIRDHTPVQGKVILKEVPKSIMGFSTRLLKKLLNEKPGENLLFYPMNIYTALFMHMDTVSVENVKEELRKVMRIFNAENDNGKSFESGVEELWRRFEHHDVPSNSENSNSERLTPAHGIFVQSDNAVINALYKSLQNQHYPNATYTHVDFQRHAEEATRTVNAFIAEHTKYNTEHNTEHRIEKFYDQTISPITKGILVHTVQFSSLWQYTFPTEHTEVGRFHTTENDVIEVPMMRNQAVISHTFSDALLIDIIALKCKGGEHALFVTLPRPSQTIQNITEYGHLYNKEELHRNMKAVSVDYKIPKMKFSMENSLVEPLGLKNVFEHADQLRHHVEVHFDERGMEAVAATAVGNEHQRQWSETPTTKNVHSSTAAPVKADVKFYVDRPFFVTLFHLPTNLIQFQGVVTKPYWRK